jgi:hypothetical protein
MHPPHRTIRRRTGQLGCAQVMRLPCFMVLMAGVALLPACGENIWRSGGHPATAPDQVRILLETPAKYERLGTVTHLYAEGSPWQDGMDGTAVFQDLLAEAGGMGANALVLADDTTMADTSIHMKCEGKSYTLPVIGKSKTVVGQAIFVTKE